MNGRFSELFEIQQLTAHHDEISPRQKNSSYPANRRRGMPDRRFYQKTARLSGLRNNEIAYHDIAKEKGPDCFRFLSKGYLTVALKINHREHEHHGLTESKIIQAADEYPGTPSA